MFQRFKRQANLLGSNYSLFSVSSFSFCTSSGRYIRASCVPLPFACHGISFSVPYSQAEKTSNRVLSRDTRKRNKDSRFYSTLYTSATVSKHSIRNALLNDKAGSNHSSCSRYSFSTLSQKEIDHFNSLAEEWWKKDGGFSVLHLFNPVRINFLRKHVESSPRYSEIIRSEEYIKNKESEANIYAPLYGVKILDVGSGGGLLSEGLAEAGAQVVGIEPSEGGFYVANKHLRECSPHLLSRLTYKQCEVSNIKKELCNADKNEQQVQKKFDAVICSEVIEHVENMEEVVKDIFACTAKGGTVVFSTFNKTIESYLVGIICAEYITGTIPKGTHEWSKFVPPSDLIKLAEKHNAFHIETYGYLYFPILRTFITDPFNRVQYIVAFRQA